MDNVCQSTTSGARPRVEVIFEFSVVIPKLTFYRGVKTSSGGFRMEKRGQNAKKYRTVMWCGSEDGLYRYREAVEYFNGMLYTNSISTIFSRINSEAKNESSS
jgi:hypothetical protein